MHLDCLKILRKPGEYSIGQGQVFFFDRIFDPDSGATVFPLENEVRSIYHRDFMRPLVNRWPIANEPFSDQAEVMADLEQELGFMPGGKLQ